MRADGAAEGEATCYKRALYAMADGRRGVFVLLPVTDEQPFPYLFVPVQSTRALPPKKGQSMAKVIKHAQVQVTFRRRDVCGLESDVVEANIANDPHSCHSLLLAAMKRLQTEQQGGGAAPNSRLSCSLSCTPLSRLSVTSA